MNIIYFPHKLGQRKNGVQNSYKLFKNTGKIVECKDDIKYLFENLNNLYLENSISQEKNLNIGGDHSMAISTVADSLNKHKNLKVLWIDAHPDINIYEKSSTKNFHGMPLAFLTNLDSNKNFTFIKNHLDFKNLLYIGIRDIDTYEKEVITKYNINYIKCEELNSNPINTLQKINEFLKDDPYHLSFDVDSLDPSFIPCTGTPVEGGLDLEKTKYILDNLKTKNLVNMDLTELNLELGNKEEQEKTMKNVKYLLDKYL
jgi:arginase